MPTPNDEMLMWMLSRVPMDVAMFMTKVNPGAYDADKENIESSEHEDSFFFSRGTLATIRSAVLLFVIEVVLPQQHRWIYYWLLVFSWQNLVRRVYLFSYAQVLILWYYPSTSPTWWYSLALIFDGYERLQVPTYGFHADQIAKSVISTLTYIQAGQHLLYKLFEATELKSWLETNFGPMENWAYVAYPVFLCYQILDERSPINATVPEGGRQGIVAAALSWTCMRIFPTWFPWVLWPLISAPDTQDAAMFVKWGIYTVSWIWSGVPLSVAYGTFLFVNMFTQQEQHFRHAGSTASNILLRQRKACVSFIMATFALRIGEVELENCTHDIENLAMYMDACSLLLLILSTSAYLMQDRLRMHEHGFRHMPITGANEIRLLRLYPGSLIKNSPICSEMVHVRLNSPPAYDAISHRWASSDEQLKIIYIDGARFHVSQGLYSLLLAKRKNRHHVLLWIDSICIDQLNLVEKSRQVSMMRNIFEEARSTIGWLEDHPKALRLLELVQQLERVQTLTEFLELRNQPDIGWEEMKDLLSQDWFERVWIIQEIAVAAKSMIRYGNLEIEWQKLIRALNIVLYYDCVAGVSHGMSHGYLINALVIETFRLCVANVDYLRLVDVLKLGTIFRSTLPVDKVFALLAITEDRNRPLSHLDFPDNVPNPEIWRAKGVIKDLQRTVDTINDLRGTASWQRNSRRSRRILAGPNAMRYVNALKKDETRLLVEVTRLARKYKDLKPEELKAMYDVLRPEYSKHATPEVVYSLVAKTIMGNGDVDSLMQHAGIGWPRNKALDNLPSWVPDWSAGLGTYVFPLCRRSIPEDSGQKISKDDFQPSMTENSSQGERKTPQKPPSSDSTNFSDIDGHGFQLYTLKGRLVGRVSQLFDLAVIDTVEDHQGTIDDVAVAASSFLSQRKNYQQALACTYQASRQLYSSGEECEDALFRTTLADISSDGSTPAPVSEVQRLKSWIYGEHEDCRISTTMPPQSNRLETFSSPDQVPGPTEIKDLCRKWLSTQRLQQSTMARYMHMIRTTILPSFNTYRWPDDDHGGELSASSHENDSNRSSSRYLFDTLDKPPFSSFSRNVDYTIGRKFAILESGHMGLVPSGARQGDVFVNCDSSKYCYLLRSSTLPGMKNARGTSGEFSKDAGMNEDILSVEKFVRLVGVSYVHDIDRISASMVENTYTLW